MVFFRLLLRLLHRSAADVPAALAPRASPCDLCPLGACAAGSQATVLCISCHALDAQRLRTLGLFEGVRVGVVDTRSGMVLDVRGSRVALGHGVAAGITVRPVQS